MKDMKKEEEYFLDERGGGWRIFVANKGGKRGKESIFQVKDKKKKNFFFVNKGEREKKEGYLLNEREGGGRIFFCE